MRVINKLLNKIFGYKKPGKVRQFRVEVTEMANVRLTWQWPNVSQRQRPIAHALIDARVAADLPWTQVAQVPAPSKELLIEDAAPGTWYYRARVVDVGGTVGPEATASASLDHDAPGAMVEFAATVE